MTGKKVLTDLITIINENNMITNSVRWGEIHHHNGYALLHFVVSSEYQHL